MISNTPQFDKALADYFAALELDNNGGQWRDCRFLGKKFYVRSDDIKFYKKIAVPLPTLSPMERARRKMAFYNGYNLSKGISAFSGKSLISEYPSDTPFKIYEHQIWFGEDWEPFDYAMDYQPHKTFFEQFRELQLKTPRPNLRVDASNINSDFTNGAFRLKDCYLIFDTKEAENSAYGIAVDHSKNCFDCLSVFHSEQCYNCFEGSRLFKCFFAEHCRYCLESYFLFDCRDCDHCFMCANLRHKKYYFFNQPLTAQEYEAELAKINLGDRDTMDLFLEKFAKLKSQAIYKENHNDRAVNCFGDYMQGARNCYACFYSVASENLAYSLASFQLKDSYDAFGGLDCAFVYDSNGGFNNYGLKFSFGVKFSRNLEYCDSCVNCHDCFGCIGLKNKSFCALNKQYEENEYWQKLDAIKAAMLENGQYGEFFPPEMALVPYNISVATSYQGFDDIEKAKQYGYIVRNVPATPPDTIREVMEASVLPEDIKNVQDDILGKVIFDRKNNKKFRYIKAELDFHRRNNLCLPLEHPSVRLTKIRKMLGPITLNFYGRDCAKCGKKMQSVYPAGEPAKVYCEECYLKAVV